MISKKRFLAGLCAMVLSLGVSACGASDSGDTDTGAAGGTPATTTEEKEANAIELSDDAKKTVESVSETADLPDIQLDNPTVKFIAHWDINPGDGEATPAFLELFKSKYGGEIKYIPTTWNDRYSDITKYILSKDSPDFFPAMDMDGFPKGALKGIFQPIDDYIDFGSDFWKRAEDTNKNFLFSGKHYVVSTGSSPNLVCIYNNRTFEELNLEKPYELYQDGLWDWNHFESLCKDFMDKSTAEDHYAIDGYWCEQGLNSSTGTPLIRLNNGKAQNNITDGNVKKAQNFLYSLNEKGYFFNRKANGNSTRTDPATGEGTTGYGLGTHQTLFIPCGLWGIESNPESTVVWGDIEAGDVMFVPMPRPDGDFPYWMDARLENGYFLIKNAPNPRGFAAFMACEMAIAYDEEANAIRDAQLRNDYKWTDEMMEMREEVYRLCHGSNTVFDFSGGVSDEVSAVVNEIKYLSTDGAEPMKWDDVVAKYNEKLDFQINEANNQIPVK